MAILMSYDLANPSRDVQPYFDDLVAKQPILLGMIKRGPDFSGADATSKYPKLEWVERQLTQTSYTIASFDTNGLGTGINLNSTAGLSAYDVLYFTSSTGQRRAELVQIASVDSATDLTVVRQYGSSTSTTLVVGDIVYVLKPVEEGSSASESSIVAPTVQYNTPAIVQRAIKMSKTRLGITTYGQTKVEGKAAEMILDAMHQKMLEITWEMNGYLINGVRVPRTNATTAKGTPGGLFQFLSGGNVETTGGVFSYEHINNCLQLIYEDGNPPGSIDMLVMNANQARRMSKWAMSGTNPVVFYDRSATTFGSTITQFQGDLPGNISKIVIEPNMPTDCVFLLNSSLIEINYLAGRTMKDLDANSNEAEDFIARRLLAEFSFTIRNGQTAHGMITGLTV